MNKRGSKGGMFFRKIKCERCVCFLSLETLMYVSLLVPKKSERGWITLFNLIRICFVYITPITTGKLV